jgi:hypothetical protein
MGNKFCKHNNDVLVDSRNQPMSCMYDSNICYISDYDAILSTSNVHSSNFILTNIKCSFDNNGNIDESDINLINNYSNRRFIGTPDMETKYYWTYANIITDPASDNPKILNYNELKKRHIENKNLFIEPSLYTSNVSDDYSNTYIDNATSNFLFPIFIDFANSFSNISSNIDNTQQQDYTYDNTTYPNTTYPYTTYPNTTYPYTTYPYTTYPNTTYPYTTYPNTNLLTTNTSNIPLITIPSYVYTPIDKEVKTDIFFTLLIVFSVIVIFLLLLFVILLFARRR